MTQARIKWTLLILLGVAGCRGDILCTQEDLPSIRLTVRPAGGGDPIEGIIGTARGRFVRSFGCPVEDGAAKCWVHIGGSAVDLHLEREGFFPWDTTGVKLMWSGDGCMYPMLQHLDAEMQRVS